jgi:hypothetical protein
LTIVKQYSQIVGKNYAKNALSQSYRKMTELSMQSSYYSSCPCIERASKMSWRKRKEREEKSFFYEKGNFISSKKKLFSAAVAETATSVQSSSIGKSASQALGKLNGHSVGRSVGRSVGHGTFAPSLVLRSAALAEARSRLQKTWAKSGVVSRDAEPSYFGQRKKLVPLLL